MTTTTEGAEPDLLGRTPEQVQADRERRRRDRDRILARNWHEVPRGYYAVPVYDVLAVVREVGNDEPAREPEVIGYRLFERKVARRCKTGRVIGQDDLAFGSTMCVIEGDGRRVRDEICSDRESANQRLGPGGYLKETIAAIMLDVAGPDSYRAKFGQLTGKCGCCGRRLTTARSKLLGIGPECRGYR